MPSALQSVAREHMAQASVHDEGHTYGAYMETNKSSVIDVISLILPPFHTFDFLINIQGLHT